MRTTARTTGKTELAQLYFPHITSHAAWRKLRSIMMEYGTLRPLATMHRRTLTPRETAAVMRELGRP